MCVAENYVRNQARVQERVRTRVDRVKLTKYEDCVRFRSCKDRLKLMGLARSR